MIDDECELAGETEILGENLSQCLFSNHKLQLTWSRTPATVVGSRRVTARAMARPQPRMILTKRSVRVQKTEGCNITHLLFTAVVPLWNRFLHQIGVTEGSDKRSNYSSSVLFIVAYNSVILTPNFMASKEMQLLITNLDECRRNLS
jgi:hypothetical protein